MEREIKQMLYEKGADIVRFVDISALPYEQTGGLGRAVLLSMALSKQFVLDIFNDSPTSGDEYLEKEQRVEALADWLADFIHQNGYRACSQSEKANLDSGLTERGFVNPDITEGISALPQKTIARMAGLGFIGKNNLLVTEEYGCALSVCSVLTDAPLTPENRSPIPSRCGKCADCVENCPAGALLGAGWTPDGGRDALVDVTKCGCALKCMMSCPWTLKYARRTNRP